MRTIYQDHIGLKANALEGNVGDHPSQLPRGIPSAQNVIQVEPDRQRGFQAQKFPPVNSSPTLHRFSSGILKGTPPSRSLGRFNEALKPIPSHPEPTFYPDFRALGNLLLNWARCGNISRKLEKEALNAN
jgi:hypothetical protein